MVDDGGRDGDRWVCGRLGSAAVLWGKIAFCFREGGRSSWRNRRERLGEGGVVVGFQREGAASPWLGEERLVSKERKGFSWRLREKKPRVTAVRGTVW